jgi:integrase
MSRPSQPLQVILQDTLTYVNAFLDSCRARGLSRKTLLFYSDYLLKLAQQYPEFPDTPEQLENFICRWTSGARRHGAFRSIRAFYNWAEKRYNTPNPMKAVGAPRVHPTERPALTIDQLRQLLEYPHHRPVIRALLYFLADTGVRIGEAANLTTDDIFPDSVRVKGKTGERIIPISPGVRQMLLELPPGKVFPGLSHWLSELVIKAGKAAGVNVSAHDLRRTFATNWRGSDMSLKYIGGWASWRMVEHYSQRRLDKAQDDHKQFSPVALLNPHTQQKSDALAPQPASVDTIIRLAEELGAAKERIKQLEEIINNNGLAVLVKG